VSLRKADFRVSNHAIRRYKERVGPVTGVGTVVDAVRRAKVIPRADPLPLPVPRVDGRTYARGGDAVFVLRSESATLFELITVMRAAF
jgi:hypothetical protein